MITGTRIAVSIVIGSLAGGMTPQEVMDAYDLTKEQMEGALSYATDLVKQAAGPKISPQVSCSSISPPTQLLQLLLPKFSISSKIACLSPFSALSQA